MPAFFFYLNPWHIASTQEAWETTHKISDDIKNMSKGEKCLLNGKSKRKWILTVLSLTMPFLLILHRAKALTTGKWHHEGISSLRLHGGPSIVSACAFRNDPIKEVQIGAYGSEINAVTPRSERATEIELPTSSKGHLQHSVISGPPIITSGPIWSPGTTRQNTGTFYQEVNMLYRGVINGLVNCLS